MKSLGLNPSIQEVKDLIREVDPNGDGDIDFNGKTSPYLLYYLFSASTAKRDGTCFALTKVPAHVTMTNPTASD